MSYLSFIPENPNGSEHMTLVWCGKVWDKQVSQMEREAQVLGDHCPFDGVVFAHDVFLDNRVALLAIPHKIHFLRTFLAMYDESGRGLDWQPHITAMPGCEPLAIGSVVKFTHGEWRQ